MDADLVALAEAHGVATWFENSQRQRQDVPEATVVAVLGLLGVDASSAEAVRAALAEVREPGLPGTVVVRTGATYALPGPATITLEDGSTVEAAAGVPGDLPLGWHTLRTADAEATLVVVPERLPEAPEAWGWMLQLYALHSAGSWGMGDLGDLREFAGWAAADGAGLVLLNPLHAITPTLPVPSSPYSPSSRRFANPLYLRIADTAAYQRADEPLRANVDALAGAARPGGDLIDYTAVWQAKRAALELLWPLAGEVDLASDPGLTDFATFCALAETHGPDWHTWPEELRRPGPAARAAANADRVAFHAWLQHLLDEQLAAATAAADGMSVGVVLDLAVGIDPSGADGWLLQDVLAEGVHAGAPPDAFNQLGQDWGLACWRPDRLAATGYAAYRDMLRRLLRRAGGIRVDHVAQLWRLWWVPPGMASTEGTYVRYDPDAMLGILALEAHRAGAVVVGEDLGTVLPVVTKGLQDQNMLGSAVLWFTKTDDGEYVASADYPRNALASISTHDLPTASGFLTGEHVTVRAELNQLAGPVEQERARADADRAELIELLRGEKLLAEDATNADIVVAMHAFLRNTPCRLVTASLYDVLDEVRQPNLPGTTDEYPNWRIPLPASLEEIQTDPRVRRIVGVLNATKGAA
ncbi:4-alpha-glucanotransferase [Spirilliplanes yamanashiensis]|uniref:4-alpha-glucanotransferase n=1 Tax=Spirilliplanes yamanashiensis TaxID=42233 RepID=A0A8J4DHC0_9ACTN|nr:4-alpha-glucanotransferase [Spirilliplanes yamanashiensis]MDP9820145.1 4-alpha-glucanotransferase [Spirilliplanes yamanashiensis]GIJ01035.1 4-alpha-glucanotransferase [Spirilliplanes yamanashiensis]